MEQKPDKQINMVSGQAGNDPYEDLYEREHPVSKKHPQMSLQQRAAQFAPFAALVGSEDMIDDAGDAFRKNREADEAGFDPEQMILADDGE